MGRHVKCYRAPQWASDREGVGPGLVIPTVVSSPSSSHLWIQGVQGVGLTTATDAGLGGGISVPFKRPWSHSSQVIWSGMISAAAPGRHNSDSQDRTHVDIPAHTHALTQTYGPGLGRTHLCSYLYMHRCSHCFSTHAGAHHSPTSVQTYMCKYCSCPLLHPGDSCFHGSHTHKYTPSDSHPSPLGDQK